MTESEIVGQRYLLKIHLAQSVEDRLKTTPDLTIREWIYLISHCPESDGIDCDDLFFHGLDIDDLIWCWRKATGEA